MEIVLLTTISKKCVYSPLMTNGDKNISDSKKEQQLTEKVLLELHLYFTVLSIKKRLRGFIVELWKPLSATICIKKMDLHTPPVLFKFKEMCELSKCNIRWLSQGAIVQQFFYFSKEVCYLMVMKRTPINELSYSYWIADLGVLNEVDCQINFTK